MTPIGDDFAGPMSQVDGCTCGNSEPPRAAVPSRTGWLCSYLCADCGRAWVTDYEQATLPNDKEA